MPGDQPSWAHHAVGLYAEASLATGPAGPHVRAFDRTRQVRNRREYVNQPITEQLLTTDLEHAKQSWPPFEVSGQWRY